MPILQAARFSSLRTPRMPISDGLLTVKQDKFVEYLHSEVFLEVFCQQVILPIAERLNRRCVIGGFRNQDRGGSTAEIRAGTPVHQTDRADRCPICCRRHSWHRRGHLQVYCSCSEYAVQASLPDPVQSHPCGFHTHPAFRHGRLQRTALPMCPCVRVRSFDG